MRERKKRRKRKLEGGEEIKRGKGGGKNDKERKELGGGWREYRDDNKSSLCEPHSLVSGPDCVNFWDTTHSDLAEVDNGFPGDDPG